MLISLLLLPILLLSTSSSAAVLPHQPPSTSTSTSTSTCSITLLALSTSGGLDPSPIDLSPSGLNHLGGTTSTSIYNLNATTSQLRTPDTNLTCVIAPSTNAFACVAASHRNANASTPFHISKTGNLVHSDDRSSGWLACPDPSDLTSGIYNIFSDAKGDDGSGDCSWIEIVVSGGEACVALAAAAASTSCSTATPFASTTTFAAAVTSTSAWEDGEPTAAATTTSCSAATPFATAFCWGCW